MKTVQKTLAALLSAIVICSALAIPTFASEEPRLYIAGIEVTPENAANITGSGITGKISYDIDDHVLTLYNAKVLSSGIIADDSAPIIFNASDEEVFKLTIELIGSNTIRGRSNDITDYSDGIVCNDAALTIRSAQDATGSLIVSSGEAHCTDCDIDTYPYSYGIYATGSIVIDNCTVSATADYSLGGCYAIDSGYGDIIITDSTVDAITAKGDGDDCVAITAFDDITVTDSTVTTTVGKSVSENYGILSREASVAIDKSTVHVTNSETTNGVSIGIHAYTDINMTDSTLTVTSGKAGDDSYGFYSDNGSIEMTDSNVTVTASDARDSCVAIEPCYELIITDSTVTATANKAGGDCSAIYSYDGGTSINNSTVTMTSKEATGNNFAFISSGDIEIIDSTVTVTAGKAGEGSSGFYCYNGIEIENSTVTATAEEAEDTSFGISANPEYLISVKDGTLISSGADAAILGSLQLSDSLRYVRVKKALSLTRTIRWNRISELAGEESPYKYVEIRCEQTVWQTIAYAFSDFFYSIFDFFSNIFNPVN